MKKLSYLILLISFTAFSQQNDNLIIYQLLGNHNGYYNRNILIEPIRQTNVANIFFKIQNDSLLIKMFKSLKKDFILNLKDTIQINEDKISFKKNHLKHKIKQINREYFDSLAIDKISGSPLNGFYKVFPKDKKKDYNYYFGYFSEGIPYVPYHNNLFEFYSDNKIIKRRYFISNITDKFPLIINEYPYNQYSLIEDYIPISKGKMRREIKTWPSEKLLVEDTVTYSGRNSFIEGAQNIYYNEDNIYQIKRNLLQKTHIYKKGKLTTVKKYIYEHSSIETRITDLTHKNFKTVIEKRDHNDNLQCQKSLINVQKKGCSQSLLDKYYTGIDGYEQCFLPHGEWYEYKGSENKLHFLDSEEVIRYEKGILTYYQLEYINPFVEVSDNLTLKTFGKPIVAGRKDISNYKEQTSTREYYSKPDNKLFLRIKTTYKDCIKHSLFESYCKNKKNNASGKYKTQIEFYDYNGKLIFNDTFDQNFKGDYKDYLNNIF